jgi:acetyltransferase-like isoleucine patch superfamily enzyme
MKLESQMTRKAIDDAVVMHATHTPAMEDPLRLLPRSLTKLYSIWVSLTYPFASVGQNLSVHFTCEMARSRAHRIKLGDSVRILKDAIVDVVAPPEQDGEPIVVLDDHTQIGYRCVVSAKNLVHIERDVIMAQSVVIIDHGYTDRSAPLREGDGVESGRIRIGQGSWIGQGAAIVCPRGELILGRNCVVAAKAVVTRSFPPHSVIFGNPARVIKQFDPSRNAWVLGSVS